MTVDILNRRFIEDDEKKKILEKKKKFLQTLLMYLKENQFGNFVSYM